MGTFNQMKGGLKANVLFVAVVRLRVLSRLTSSLAIRGSLARTVASSVRLFGLRQLRLRCAEKEYQKTDPTQEEIRHS